MKRYDLESIAGSTNTDNIIKYVQNAHVGPAFEITDFILTRNVTQNGIRTLLQLELHSKRDDKTHKVSMNFRALLREMRSKGLLDHGHADFIRGGLEGI